MNVILQGDGSPFGVLEVDSRSEGEFGEKDIAFLQGAANILGMAIEQQQYQRKLQAALDRHQILLKEVNHRVKNSLQVVSSMLHLQASAVGDPALSDRLTKHPPAFRQSVVPTSDSPTTQTTRILILSPICASYRGPGGRGRSVQSSIGSAGRNSVRGGSRHSRRSYHQ